MTVKELKELIEKWPEDAIISKWEEDDTRINSEVEEIDYLYTTTVEKGKSSKTYIILG